MDPRHYFDFLYPFQDDVLKRLSSLETQLYLTGGTAASRGYLRHRFSDDLDLFANDAPQFRLWTERAISALASDSDWRLEVLLREERFVRLNLERGQGSLKIEFANDVPAHVGALRNHPTLGRLDSPENILANKITALIDRREPKDLADIWGFCCIMGLEITAALEGAQSKAAGIFPADLARVLMSATEADWSLVRWVEAPAPARFLSDVKQLGERLLLLP
jgi:hypothetical protein